MAEPSNVYADWPEDSDLLRELHVIPADYSWDGDWELTGDLVVEVQTCQKEVLAITRLPVEEYGTGASLEEAVLDLLTSLSEYRESLEEREARLGAPAVADLAKLRGIIRRCSRR
jgi:hypothetical protein